jgi:branched-chain amino acid aminotransferase
MKSHEEASSQVVWLNGRFLPLHEAAVSPMDRGVLYGDGIFETIRAEDGWPLFLDEHLARASHSLALLRIKAGLPPDIHSVLRELLRLNDLFDNVASLKIVVTRGVGVGIGLPHPTRATICMTSLKYTPPESSIYERGWRLEVFQEGFSPPLSAHKTLNYLFFLVARQAALDAGGDEAVILDHHGKVSETSAGSLMVRSKGIWWTPYSPHQLPGITIRQLSKVLHEVGVEVEQWRATAQDLLDAETIWVVNSMMGIMPVAQVGNQSVPNPSSQEASRLRKLLFARGR